MRIDLLKAPLLVAWQLTRDCDLCCLHCCTESAPGKRLSDELGADEAMALVGQIVANEVPYVMLCGGEPLVVPHFLAVAEALGDAGVELKVETNGQRLDAATVARLARLPIRSVQVSLDGDTEDVYRSQRLGGSLARAHAACRAVRDAGLPLEITFAPTRLNIDEAPAVIERARALGAFRFNTGALMRIGTAARRFDTLRPTAEQYRRFRALLDESSRVLEGELELCYVPFTMEEGLRTALRDPPATLLVLPNGWVKVAAALPDVCADLRRASLQDAWSAYRRAWRHAAVLAGIHRAAAEETRHAMANQWQFISFAGVQREGSHDERSEVDG
jgi:MoaA/NifB/PqqE/SkfB family radical SAM enzyme